MKVYEELKFENPDGGAWKQGWRVTYPEGKWNSDNLLHVFVLPHSHTDPGKGRNSCTLNTVRGVTPIKLTPQVKDVTLVTLTQIRGVISVTLTKVRGVTLVTLTR